LILSSVNGSANEQHHSKPAAIHQSLPSSTLLIVHNRRPLDYTLPQLKSRKIQTDVDYVLQISTEFSIRVHDAWASITHPWWGRAPVLFTHKGNVCDAYMIWYTYVMYTGVNATFDA